MSVRKIGNRFSAETRVYSALLSEATVDECVSVEIVKVESGEPVPDGEPLFLLRARDHLALATLEFYRTLCVRDGCNHYMLELLNESLAAFKTFAADNPRRMKQPGVTRGR